MSRLSLVASRLGAVALMFALLGAGSAQAVEGPFAARDTAEVLPKGGWSVGVFNPLRYGLGGGFELQGHPVVFLVSPNVVVRKQQFRGAGWALTGELGASVPTLALRLVRGYLFPTEAEIPWMIVPRLGAAASFNPSEAGGALDAGDASVLTFSMDLAYGFAFGPGDVGPLGTYAPLEVLLSPALGKYRFRAGVGYDHRLLPWLRGRVYADGYSLGGETGNELVVRAGIGADVRVGQSGRVTVGAVWWNANQGAHSETGEFSRSNDVYPTADFIWTW